MKAASVTLRIAVVVAPSKEIAPVALNVPATSKVVPGELVAIPTRSVLASTLIKLACVTPENVASLLAPAALNVKSPPLRVTFPVASNVPLALTLPMSLKTSKAVLVAPSTKIRCFAPSTNVTLVPPAGPNNNALPTLVVASSTK